MKINKIAPEVARVRAADSAAKSTEIIASTLFGRVRALIDSIRSALRRPGENSEFRVEADFKPGDDFVGRVVFVSPQYALVENDAGRCAKLDRVNYSSDLSSLKMEITRGDRLALKVHRVKADGSVLLCRQGFSADEIAGLPVGARVRGKVLALRRAFALVTLPTGVLGGVSRYELTWGQAPDDVAEVLAIGDEADFIVKGLNAADRKIFLSLKKAVPSRFAHVA